MRLMIGQCRFCRDPIGPHDIWTARTSPVTGLPIRLHYRCEEQMNEPTPRYYRRTPNGT